MDTIWKPKTNLAWKDFKGIPDNKSEFGAVIFWDVDDKIDSLAVRNDTMVFKYTAQAVMSDSSWVKRDQQNSDLLKHEQGHFDIGRLCAREMEDSIRKTVFLQGEFPEKYIRIREGILSKFKSMNRQYDDETNYFRNKLNQEKWNVF